jgi:multidrug efflux pump subunit AcrB
MIFSFFVAVIITPWLMVKIAGKGRRAHAHDAAHGHRWRRPLGGPMPRRGRPMLKTKARSLGFLLVTAVLSFGSLGALLHPDVTVKLLPFDNKSELSVVIDLPEGSSVEATDRVAQDVAAVVMGLPEVARCRPMPARPRPSTSTGWCATTYLRQEPHLGEVQINLVPKDDRDRASHAIALDIRERLRAGPVPRRHQPEGGRAAAGAAGDGHAAGRDLRPRRRNPARGGAKVREAFESVPFIVDVDDSFGTRPAAARHGLDR